MGMESRPSRLPSSPETPPLTPLRQLWDAFRARRDVRASQTGRRHERFPHSPAVPTRPVRTALLLFLGCLFVYHVNGRNQSGFDTIPPTYTAWALAQHGSLDLRGYPEMSRYEQGFSVRALPDGRWVSMRPPGSALAAVPIVA